jgi:hypothetical protein
MASERATREAQYLRPLLLDVHGGDESASLHREDRLGFFGVAELATPVSVIRRSG